MAATREDIMGWFKRGKNDNQTHMIVVCDTFEYDDYPVFCDGLEEFEEKYAEHDGKNMQKIMEVYDLNKSEEEQMAQDRCYNYPEGFVRKAHETIL